jgi:hypothetical protein
MCNRDEADRREAQYDDGSNGGHGKKRPIVQSNPRSRTQGKKSDPDKQRQEEVPSSAEETL